MTNSDGENEKTQHRSEVLEGYNEEPLNVLTYREGLVKPDGRSTRMYQIVINETGERALPVQSIVLTVYQAALLYQYLGRELPSRLKKP